MTDVHVRFARVISHPGDPDRWRISGPHFRDDVAVGRFTRSSRELDDRIELTGDRALELARAVFPRIDRRGGGGSRDIHTLPATIRLALKMTAHEETERRAMEGELAELEAAWREARSERVTLEAILARR